MRSARKPRILKAGNTDVNNVEVADSKFAWANLPGPSVRRKQSLGELTDRSCYSPRAPAPGRSAFPATGPPWPHRLWRLPRM